MSESVHQLLKPVATKFYEINFILVSAQEKKSWLWFIFFSRGQPLASQKALGFALFCILHYFNQVRKAVPSLESKIEIY
jgi:hypothetical protein